MLVNYTDNVSGNLCYVNNSSASYVAPTSLIATATTTISDTTITMSAYVSNSFYRLNVDFTSPFIISAVTLNVTQLVLWDKETQ